MFLTVFFCSSGRSVPGWNDSGDGQFCKQELHDRVLR